MNRYNISAALAPLERETEGDVLVLLTSEELERGVSIPGLERVLCHTPSARTLMYAKRKPGTTACAGRL